MDIKKSEKANLGNKKLLFVEIGLIISLCITYVGFNWKTELERTVLEDMRTVEEEPEIPNIETETPPPPPVEIQAAPVLSDIIDIVEDDVEIEVEVINIEDDDNWEVEIREYVDVEEEVVDEAPVEFFQVSEKPTFNGGDPTKEFTKWVNQRLEYPEIAKENGIQGRVTLQFTVDKDGSVKDIRVLRGVDPALDKEAIRVVSMSPKWAPGKQRDRTVAVKFTFPIIFQLR